MAGARKPGPQCGFNDPVDIEDGTSYRAVSPAPGPLGADLGDSRVSGGSHTPGDSAECVLIAYNRAVELAPGAVQLETGYLLGRIPGLFQGFRVIVDGDPGFGSGAAILPSLGIEFLQDAIGEGLKEMLSPLRKGIATARQAGDRRGADRVSELDRAGDELTRAIAILVRLILHGIVTYRARNSAAGSDESRAKVLEQLRSSDLASGFAVWVEKNWEDLVKNPRLRLKVRNLLESIDELETESQPPRRKTAPEEDPRTWVAVRLVDADGNPVPGQKYQIQLPDSSIEEGTLDADGSVRFNNILPGQCKVRFPDIHGDEWTPA